MVLSLAVAAVAVMAGWLMDWWGPRPGIRLFVPEELARYRGGPGDPGLYLALLGRVYDVSSGRRHYEPGAHYSGFAGIGQALTPFPPAWARSHPCGGLRSFSSLFLRASSSHLPHAATCGGKDTVLVCSLDATVLVMYPHALSAALCD